MTKMSDEMGSAFHRIPLSAEAREALRQFVASYWREDDCPFCSGGWTCLCGSCPPFEYHASDCILMQIHWLLTQAADHPDQPYPALVFPDDYDWYVKRKRELEEELKEGRSDFYIPNKQIVKGYNDLYVQVTAMISALDAKLDQVITQLNGWEYKDGVWQLHGKQS